MIFNDNIARPYIYLITYNDTGEYYIGYHETNVGRGIPAIRDIGVVYFTSSKKIKKRGLENTTIEIINEFEGINAGDDAFDNEQQLIWQNWGDPLCLNENVRLSISIKKFKAKKGHIFSEIHRKRLSLSHIGLIQTVKTNEKRKNALIGRKNPNNSKPGTLNPFFNKHHSKSQKKKWSVNRKGLYLGEKNPSAKLNETSVREIKKHLADKKLTNTEISRLYNVNKCTIGDISKGRHWNHVY